MQDLSRFGEATLINQSDYLILSHPQLLLSDRKINIIFLLTKSMIEIFSLCGHSVHAGLILVADTENYVARSGQIHEHLRVKPWSCCETMAEEDGDYFLIPKAWVNLSVSDGI